MDRSTGDDGRYDLARCSTGKRLRWLALPVALYLEVTFSYTRELLALFRARVRQRTGYTATFASIDFRIRRAVCNGIDVLQVAAQE